MNSKNNKGMKIVGGTLLSLAIVALLSITYATYTQTLKVTGAGTLKSAKWEIGFNESTKVVTKESTEEGYKEDIHEGDVSFDNTTLRITDAQLKRPGDSITYEFEIENKGDFDAILNAATTSITCQSSAEYESSDKTQDCKNHIEVTLMDEGNNVLAKLDSDYSKTAPNHTLIHKTKKSEKFKLKIEYKKDNGVDGTNLPTEDIKITEFGATLTYNQYSASGE